MKRILLLLLLAMCAACGAPRDQTVTVDGVRFAYAIPKGFLKADDKFDSFKAGFHKDSLMYVPKEIDEAFQKGPSTLERFVLVMPISTRGERLGPSDFQDYKKAMLGEYRRQGKRELALDKGLSLEEAVLESARAGERGLYRVVIETDNEFMTTILQNNTHKAKGQICYNALVIGMSYRIDGKIVLVLHVNNIASAEQILPWEKATFPLLKELRLGKAER